MKKEIPVTQVTDEETLENLSIEEWETETPLFDKYILAYTAIWLLVFILWFGWFVTSNKLEQAERHDSIQEIAKINIEKATKIKAGLELEIAKLETEIEYKKTKLYQADWCLENTHTWQVVDCYILHSNK